MAPDKAVQGQEKRVRRVAWEASDLQKVKRSLLPPTPIPTAQARSPSMEKEIVMSQSGKMKVICSHLFCVRRKTIRRFGASSQRGSQSSIYQ